MRRLLVLMMHLACVSETKAADPFIFGGEVQRPQPVYVFNRDVTIVTPAVVTPSPFVQYAPVITRGTTVRTAAPVSTWYTEGGPPTGLTLTSVRGVAQYGTISGGCANGKCETINRRR